MMNTQNPRHIARRRAQNGFSMIEVLIAIVVLSLGILGMASMQMMSLKHNRTAHLRSQAAAAAYDILDRMRANRTGAEAGNYYGAPAAPPADSVAEQDLSDWSNQLTSTLGAGATGTLTAVAGTCATLCQTTVAITWTEAGELGEGNVDQSFTFVSSL